MARTVGNRLTPARASLPCYINMHAIALHLQLCACRAPLLVPLLPMYVRQPLPHQHQQLIHHHHGVCR